MEAILEAASKLADRLDTNPSRRDLLLLLKKVIVQADQVGIHLGVDGLQMACAAEQDNYADIKLGGKNIHIITHPIHLKRCGQGKRLILGQGTNKRADPSLVKAITRAHCWFDELKAGASFKDIAKQTSVDQRHIARTIRLAFLAPDITEAILTGNAPQDLNTEDLLRLKTLPVDWEVQRRILGFV